MKPALVASILLVCSINTWAAGAETVARSDRSLWPEALDSVSAYNRASRAEILVFAGALADVSDQNEAALKDALRIKSADIASVKRVRDRLGDILLDNLKAARKSCVPGELLCEAIDSRAALIESGRSLEASLPAVFLPWAESARNFHRRYAGELIRLAALFPTVNSEIETFNDAERTGFELEDGQFLLTFDDGPSNQGGNTDALLAILSRNAIHGTFYVLGERLQERQKSQTTTALQSLYDGQCLALHGWRHESHEKWSQWQTSVTDTQALLKDSFPNQYRPYFRPPYGQRRSDSGPFFGANGLQVALWNIDSQDWNSKVTAADAGQRVLILMLVWRRGVILFHDIHAKAQVAVPWLIGQTRGAGIKWVDCRQY